MWFLHDTSIPRPFSKQNTRDKVQGSCVSSPAYMTRTDHHPILPRLATRLFLLGTKEKWLYQLSVPFFPDFWSSCRNELVSRKNQLLFGRAFTCVAYDIEIVPCKAKTSSEAALYIPTPDEVEIHSQPSVVALKIKLKYTRKLKTSKIFIHQPDNYMRRSYCHYTRNEMCSLKQPTKRLWVLLQQNDCHWYDLHENINLAV